LKKKKSSSEKKKKMKRKQEMVPGASGCVENWGYQKGRKGRGKRDEKELPGRFFPTRTEAGQNVRFKGGLIREMACRSITPSEGNEKWGVRIATGGKGDIPKEKNKNALGREE